jgi:hypothetical protein
MANTAHLGFALVEQSQAQKEVTVNQALVRIDALLNTGAKSRVVTAPPISPGEGDVYIVPASATGDWAGKAGQISYFEQVWRFVMPNEGMTLWVNDENVLYSYDGSAWVKSADVSEIQNASKVGVNTVADASNRLAVASDAVLFTHNGSHIQAKLNKYSSGDKAAFLFQTNYSGRAEFGTLGDDNFTLKVSPDGSSWHDVLKMIASTGRVAWKSISVAVSAAGTNQGTATALTSSLSEVTSVASGQGVVLPVPEAGEIVLVANQGTNALSIYPASGHTINNLSANVALSLGVDARRLFFAVTSSHWVSL